MRRSANSVHPKYLCYFKRNIKKKNWSFVIFPWLSPFIKFCKSVTPDVRSASLVFSHLRLLPFIPSCDRALLSSIRRALNPELGQHPRAILLVYIYMFVCVLERRKFAYSSLYPPFRVSRTRYTYLSSCYLVVTSQRAANEACFGTDPRYLCIRV